MSTIVTVHAEDTVTDVVLTACHALGIHYRPSMGLQKKVRGLWLFVNQNRRVEDIRWTNKGFCIWLSGDPRWKTNARIHTVRIFDGAGDGKAKTIVALPTYTVEKAMRVAGIDCSGRRILANEQDEVALDEEIGQFNALHIKSSQRVITPSPQDNLAHLNVIYDGKEESVSISERYSIVDLPFMLGIDEPMDKVCVCRKTRITNDYVSVALYEGESIEIQSWSNYC